MQAVVRWKAALQLISMKNIKLNKDECFDNPLKMNAGLKISKNLWELYPPKTFQIHISVRVREENLTKLLEN